MKRDKENILTEDQAKLVTLLIKGTKIQEIADQLGVSYNTILNRKKHVAVVKALKEARRAAVFTAQSTMIEKASWAAKKIIAMVDDPNATRVQFQAACKVYDSAIGVTVEDLEERVIALEEATTREV